VPLDTAGSETLYQELQKLDYYYVEDKWEYDQAVQLLPLSCPELKVLEVGCGRGYFVNKLKQIGVEVVGLELNQSAVDYAQSQNLPVHRESLKNWTQKYPQQYTVICSFQVLEHIAQPKEFIQQCLNGLAPNGQLILGVPNAKIVIDRFHVMKPVNTELDQIRRQVRITDQGVRFILLKNRADLSEQEEVKLTAILAHSKRLSIAYHLKEEFRNIYELSATVEEGKEKFKQWLLKAQSIYGKVVQTIRTHLLEICNYFINRTTSGVMEGINNRIKLIKRQAYGFLRFDNFRARTLAGFSD